MEIKEIQELVKLVNKSNIGELTIEKGDTKLTIKQKKDPSTNIISAGATAPVFAASPVQAAPVAAPAPQTPPPAKEKESSKEDNLIVIKSPMIGTFYRQPGPGKPVFINVGDEVTPGKVVCIIEAMKLFNEIESEVSGKIVKVLVEEASPVEFDQPLFLVDPS